MGSSKRKRNHTTGFIVEAVTRSGKVCESYPTYEDALHRVDQLAVEGLLGIPFIFSEFADGSQRLVREDGKPLQWHRLQEAGAAMEAPIPLCENALDLPPPVELRDLPPPMDE